MIRTSFWFTMASGTAGLVAGLALADQIWSSSSTPPSTPTSSGRVRRPVGARQLRADDLALPGRAALDRVSDRDADRPCPDRHRDAPARRRWDQGPIGVIIETSPGRCSSTRGSWRIDGSSSVSSSTAPAPRDEQVRDAARASALFLWALNFSDRFFLVKLAGPAWSGSRSASGWPRRSSSSWPPSGPWPAFAYSIEDDDEAKRTYSFILTYIVVITSWMALALGVLAPWLVRLLTTEDYSAERVVAPLAFAAAAFGAYIVIVIGIGHGAAHARTG